MFVVIAFCIETKRQRLYSTSLYVIDIFTEYYHSSSKTLPKPTSPHPPNSLPIPVNRPCTQCREHFIPPIRRRSVGTQSTHNKWCRRHIRRTRLSLQWSMSTLARQSMRTKYTSINGERPVYRREEHHIPHPSTEARQWWLLGESHWLRKCVQCGPYHTPYRYT
jgi:hypothetical protein